MSLLISPLLAVAGEEIRDAVRSRRKQHCSEGRELSRLAWAFHVSPPRMFLFDHTIMMCEAFATIMCEACSWFSGLVHRDTLLS